MKIQIPSEVTNLIANSHPFRLAIDGRCGAGKTTLALALSEEYGCEVIHLDDFFLPSGKEKKGFGNLEKDRLMVEVLLPLSKGMEIQYRRFSCAKQAYTETVTLKAGCSVIIEGSYALLSEFRFAYTHSLFLSVLPSDQEKRIRRRNGNESWEAFATRWIPDEEACIAVQKQDAAADLCLILQNEEE